MRSPSSVPVLPCACASLRRAARAASQLYERELRETGLSMAQFTLLYALDEAGPVVQGRLGDALALDATTLSRTVRPLLDARWARARPGADGRERWLEITVSGRRRLRDALPHWERAQARLRTQLGADRWAALFPALAEVADAARSA